MKKIKKKVAIAIPRTEKDADIFLNNANFKKALEIYKSLFEANPSDVLQEKLRESYLGYANALALKGMYKEAISLWTNHQNFCKAGCEHTSDYVHWLLMVGREKIAADVFAKNMHAFSAEQLACLEEVFAALVLVHGADFLTLFPENNLINTHFIFAKCALEAYIAGDLIALEKALSGISFRSPYKHYRQLLSACVNIREGKQQVGMQILDKIPTTSPFHHMAFLVQTVEMSPYELVSLFPALTQETFDFYFILTGYETAYQSHIAKLYPLLKQPNSKALFGWLIEAHSFMNPLVVKQFCRALLPTHSGSGAIKNFERHFGLLHDSERSHIAAVTALFENRQSRAAILIKYAKSLEKISIDSSSVTLLRALALREAAAILQKNYDHEGKEICSQGFSCLKESVALDPLDKKAQLLLLNYIQKISKPNDLSKAIEATRKTLSDDPDILLFAIAHYKKRAPKKALTCVDILLKRDPIHALGWQYKVHLQINAMLLALVQRKNLIAKNLAEEVLAQAPNHLLAFVRANCLFIYHQLEDHIAVNALLQAMDFNEIQARAMFYIAANKASVTHFASLTKNLDLKPLPEKALNSAADYIALVKLISINENPELDWSLVFKQFKPQLTYAGKLAFTNNERETLLECFINIKCYDWVIFFLNQHKKYKREDWHIFYTCLAKIKNNINKLSYKDTRALEEAFDCAMRQSNTKLAAKIENLLVRAGGYDDEDVDMFSIFEQIMGKAWEGF